MRGVGGKGRDTISTLELDFAEHSMKEQPHCSARFLQYIAERSRPLVHPPTHRPKRITV